MLHRAPHFNVTAVVWWPGDTAGARNHETRGVIGCGFRRKAWGANGTINPLVSPPYLNC